MFSRKAPHTQEQWNKQFYKGKIMNCLGIEYEIVGVGGMRKFEDRSVATYNMISRIKELNKCRIIYKDCFREICNEPIVKLSKEGETIKTERGKIIYINVTSTVTQLYVILKPRVKVLEEAALVLAESSPKSVRTMSCDSDGELFAGSGGADAAVDGTPPQLELWNEYIHARATEESIIEDAKQKRMDAKQKRMMVQSHLSVPRRDDVETPHLGREVIRKGIDVWGIDWCEYLDKTVNKYYWESITNGYELKWSLPIGWNPPLGSIYS